MKAWLIWLVLATFLALMVLTLALAVGRISFTSAQTIVPPRPGQPNSDIFGCGVTNCQDYNPVTQKAKAQHTASFRLLVMPGCSTGTIPADLNGMVVEGRNKVRFELVRNDQAYDFTVRINCGSSHIAICGSISIFCLGRGFPQNADVDISDILSTYQSATRLSILLHEIFGHALGTWNEQYCTGSGATGVCAGLPRFTAAPNWFDFMNTGPNSRHGFEAIEFERWERTMYVVTQQPPGECDGVYGPFDASWGGCYHGDVGRWYGRDGWSLAVDSGCGQWYDPNGLFAFGGCDPSWNGRHVPILSPNAWLIRGTPFYIHGWGWYVTP